jgi:hypothetical protein
MMGALTAEQAASRAAAAAVVAEARDRALAARDGAGSAFVMGVHGEAEVWVSVLRGAWSVTGLDRRVRPVRDQVDAIRATVALLEEQAGARRVVAAYLVGVSRDEIAADLERTDALALAEERQAEAYAERLGVPRG